MKVAIKHEEPKEVYFEDIPFGGVFIENGEAWLKIYTLAEEADDDAEDVNCIRLEDAEQGFHYTSDLVLLPRSAELVVEY